MEHLLIAPHKSPASLKTMHYINRLLMPPQQIQPHLFHVIPTASPDLLKMDEMQRIKGLHMDPPHLSGYFWKEEDRNKTKKTFQESTQHLPEAGFDGLRIKTHFSVQHDDCSGYCKGGAEIRMLHHGPGMTRTG